MTEVLEIHLEEISRHYRGWRRVLAGGSYMNLGTFWFVARPPGPDQGSEDHVFGATFPVMGGARDLNNQHKPNSFVELAEEGLEELDRQLVRDGWVKGSDIGPYWWSRRYTRRAPS